MFGYLASLFQERPMLTMIIIFVVLTALIFVGRTLFVDIVEEFSLLRDYLSDDKSAMYGDDVPEQEEESDFFKDYDG